MRHVGLNATLFLSVLGTLHAALADGARAEDGMPIPVKLVSMQHDNRVPGTTIPLTIKVEGELGTLTVPMAKLVGIEFDADTAPSGKAIHKLTTIEGHVLVGVIVEPEMLEVATEYGKATTNWNGVRKLCFDHKPKGDAAPQIVKEPEFKAKVVMIGGDRIDGGIFLDEIAIHCQFGKLIRDPEMVRAIRFDAPADERDGEDFRVGSITTVDGRKLVGRIEIADHWTMFTDLGQLDLAAEKALEIQFEVVENAPESKTSSATAATPRGRPLPSPQPPTGETRGRGEPDQTDDPC